MSDNVNHPAHYEQQCSLECIEAMEIAFGRENVMTFCLCNAFKYLWRHKNKNGIEDLNKAKWYLDRAKSYIEYGMKENEQITAMECITDLKIEAYEDQ